MIWRKIKEPQGNGVGLTEKVNFEQRLTGDQRVSHVEILGERALSKGNSQEKALRQKQGGQVYLRNMENRPSCPQP